MSWSYSNNPASSSKDAVRFLIQDTNTLRQLVQDEEIEWSLTQEMNVYTAAASICETLVAKAGSTKEKKISNFYIVYDPMFYRTLAATLRARGSGYQVPYAGGISQSDKLAQQADADWAPPAIPRGLDNNASAPSPATPPAGGTGNPLTTI